MPPPGSLKRVLVDADLLASILEAEFHIPIDETHAYLKLLEAPDLTAEELADAVKLSPTDAHALLERMVTRGLIIRSTSKAKFAPLHPRMTLTNIFKMYEKEVVQNLRDRRATVDRMVNLLTPVYEERKR